MAKLVLHGTEGVQREIPLDKQRVTIGRSSSNDISIDDKATSSHHAAIITIGRNCYLQDLKSTNGTLVNGTPVQKHTLRHGDVILIGRNHISYLDEPEAPSAPSTAAAASQVASNGVEPAMSASLPKATAAGAAAAFDPAATLQQPVAKEVANDSSYEPWAVKKEEGVPPKDMVDSMLDAIRSHREQERTIKVLRKDTVDAEWKKLVESAQVLKKRVGNHPRVKFFDISRNHSDIMIRLQRSDEKSGQHSILISRTHPHNPSPLETIWLIESGRPDKHCESCEDIMRDLMSTLAPLIA